MPLQRLPADKLAQLAPVLQHADLALVESNRDGTMKQVTLVLYVAAPPERVHDVIARPGDYKKFVPGVSQSSWEQRSDGTWQSSWRLDLPVSSFDQTNLYTFEPGPTGAIDVRCPTEEEDATYRWELQPVRGGTVLVQYGYTDVKHSNALVRRFLKKMPVTEHGLALAAQLLLAANMKREAERRTPAGTPPPVEKTAPPGFGFLLDRGQVVLIRSDKDGSLSDISLTDRVYAPLSRLADALAHPAQWSRFVPGVDASYERDREAGTSKLLMDFGIPLVTWSTTWAMRFSDRVVEGFGLDGDLRGARFRWDLTAKSERETLVVYRVNEKLRDGSTLFRKLVSYEPSLEHGLTVAFSLVYLRAMRARAEGWAEAAGR